MTANPHISVVIPVYNEAESLAQLQSELTKVLTDYDHELVFVDDGSDDNSLQMIHRGSRVRILEFAKNNGQSAAIYAGLRAARGAILVLIDSDLQNDPNDIPRLLAEMEKGAPEQDR